MRSLSPAECRNSQHQSYSFHFSAANEDAKYDWWCCKRRQNLSRIGLYFKKFLIWNKKSFIRETISKIFRCLLERNWLFKTISPKVENTYWMLWHAAWYDINHKLKEIPIMNWVFQCVKRKSIQNFLNFW